jgi:hypothetical protein
VEAVVAFDQRKQSMPQACYPAKRPTVGSSSGQKTGRNFLAFQGGQRPGLNVLSARDPMLENKIKFGILKKLPPIYRSFF